MMRWPRVGRVEVGGEQGVLEGTGNVKQTLLELMLRASSYARHR